MISGQYKLTIIAAWCLMIALAVAQPAHGQTNQEKYDKARQLIAEGTTLAKAGTAQSNQAALSKFEQVRQLLQELNAQLDEAICLQWLGKINNSLGNKQKAIDYYAQSLTLFRAVGDELGQADALWDIGRIYSDLGEKQQALKYFNESLPLFRAVKDKNGEVSALNHVAGLYADLGEKRQALKFYNEALSLSRALNDKSSEVTLLGSIGLVHSDLGEYRQALEFLNEAWSLQIAVKNDSGAAVILNNILNNLGFVYSNLGENQQALKFYNESLSLSLAINDKRGQAVTLNNIGRVYSGLGKLEQALKYFNESLLLRRAIDDKDGEARTLGNIGAIYRISGRLEQSLKFYNQSLPLFRMVGNKRGEASMINDIALVSVALGEKQRALKLFYESLPLFHAIEDKHGKAVTLDNLFYSLARVNPRFAVFFGKQSINNYQILRANVQGLDKNLQQTFIKSVEYTYRRLAEALIEQGRYAEAQQVLNAFKDQQFFDFSRSRQFSPLALTAREAELTAKFNQTLDTVAAAIRALDEYKRSIGNRQPTAIETARLKSLAAGQAAANADYLAFLKSAEQQFAVPATIKDKFPDVPDLREMQTALRELSAQTGEKSAAVYTLVSPDNYRALVITEDSISSVSTPAKGNVLNQKALQLWRLLRTPEYDPQPLAKEIYDVVFAPLAAKLPVDTKTILWSLDGSLRYLPMAALHDGRQYLVERYNNVIFTRADKERLTRAVSNNLTGTGFGGSEAHTVKLGNENFNAGALPFVKTEMARIFKNNKSTTGILSGEVLLDSRFTRSAMISTLQKRRPLVHIASHFKFEPGDEAKSFLLLGDGSSFTLDEMKRQKDLFAGVELLTLSACETAAQREGNGREVDGFAELAQRLGAGAVMASLWEVSDDSTAELMARFYKTYSGQSGANKAASLRSAQIALLRGEYKTTGATKRQLTREDAETAAKIKIDSAKLKPFKASKIAPFAHPFYWSPFILIGNWK